MHIIHIASELAPIAKIGGLGDVIYGLSRETSHRKHQVEVIIPKYDILDTQAIEDLSLLIKTLTFPYGNASSTCSVWVGKVGGIKVYFIDPHHPGNFFKRGSIYGCPDDAVRFLLFSRAVLEFLNKKKIRPDVIHLHDWHTSAVAPLFRDLYEKKGFEKTKIMLTLHNLEYQGRCSPEEIETAGLAKSKYYHSQSLQDGTYPEAVNLLQGGILYSDFITTVSPTYAEEVKTPLFGFGLDKLLTKFQNKFSGILNGIDYEYWNPADDPYLPDQKKEKIKVFLKDRLHLEQTERPLIGSITRLVPQKGLEFIKFTIENIAEKGGQFILLGSSPIPAIQEEFQKLKLKHAGNPHVCLHLQYEEDVAHQIFAGSDMFIVPSLFEPCGLTQMIALRYGTLPLTRRTGGLKDTIFDVDTSGRAFKETNGYTFDQPDLESYDASLRRALLCWHKEREKWHQMMINGMNIDFSWKNPAKQYVEIYKTICKS